MIYFRGRADSGKVHHFLCSESFVSNWFLRLLLLILLFPVSRSSRKANKYFPFSHLSSTYLLLSLSLSLSPLLSSPLSLTSFRSFSLSLPFSFALPLSNWLLFASRWCPNGFLGKRLFELRRPVWRRSARKRFRENFKALNNGENVVLKSVNLNNIQIVK